MNGKGAYISVPNPNGTNYGAILQSRGQQGSRYLGKLYSGYDAPSELIQYIHTPLNHLNEFKKLAFLAIQRPSLEIDKDNWFMPGHRHPYANALESDFTHPDWAAKPWDDEYSLITCDENRMEVNALHARDGVGDVLWLAKTPQGIPLHHLLGQFRGQPGVLGPLPRSSRRRSLPSGRA